MIGIKLALLIAILVAGAAGAALPLRLRNASGSDRLLGWGNAFAAGVFLAAGLVHMLPDADRTWVGLGHTYPTAFALAGLAFVFMLLVEHVLLPEQAHEEMHAPSGERFARIAEHHRHAGPHSGDARADDLRPGRRLDELDLHHRPTRTKRGRVDPRPALLAPRLTESASPRPAGTCPSDREEDPTWD